MSLNLSTGWFGICFLDDILVSIFLQILHFQHLLHMDFFDIFIAPLAPFLLPKSFKVVYSYVLGGGLGCECRNPLRPDASHCLVAGTTDNCELGDMGA